MRLKLPGRSYVFYNVESKDNLAYFADDFRRIFIYAEQGVLNPMIHKVFTFDQYSLSVKSQKDRARAGKVLMKIVYFFNHKVT